MSAQLAVPTGALVGAALFAALSGRAGRTFSFAQPAALGAGIAVAGCEEAIWRGFTLVRLTPLGLGWAVALSTIGFAATHFPTQRSRGVVVHLGTGLTFAGLFVLSGGLAAAVSAHVFYNVLALAARPDPTGSVGPGAAPAAVVEMRNIAKAYGSVQALSGVELTIDEGEILALLGPNGAGKTTLVNILLGLRRPDRGEARVCGLPVGTAAARRVVGATPQEISFPPTLRVREIVDFVRAHFPEVRPRWDVVERFDLVGVARRQTGGISVGQRRRLAVALAFVGNPRVVVLDEPTTGLDVESRLQVWDAVRDHAAEGGSVLLTTHSIPEAEALADRIVVMSQGRIVVEGTAASLRLHGETSLEDAYLRLTRTDPE
jgi:ABC-2 type transport system ATP-binding protein